MSRGFPNKSNVLLERNITAAYFKGLFYTAENFVFILLQWKKDNFLIQTLAVNVKKSELSFLSTKTF